MLSTIFYALLIVMGLFFFFNGRKCSSIMIFWVIFSQGFQFLAVIPPIIKIIDLILIYEFGLLLLLTIKKPSFWSVKNDFFAKVVLLFFFIHLAYFVLTVICGYESFVFAFKVFRKFGFYLSYFIFRQLSLDEIKKVLKLMFYCTVLTGFAYYLQLLGIQIVGPSGVEGDEFVGSFVRLRNVPMWSFFYLFYLTVARGTIKFRLFWFVFFMGLLILPMMRMQIFTFFGICFIYFVISKRMLFVIKFIFPTLMMSVIFLPVLIARFENENIVNDFFSAQQMSSYDDFDNEGTFSFRIAMLDERIQYLINHHEYLFTGVGFRHEESPNCYRNFNFQLGTQTASFVHSKAQLDSIDNMWVGVLMYMGFIGVLVYLGFFIVTIIFLLKSCRYSDYIFAMFLYMVSVFVGSITAAALTHALYAVGLILLVLAFAQKYRFEYTVNKNG